MLRDHAARFCGRTLVVPTVVDTEQWRPSVPLAERPIIGWIGSPTTWPNMRPLLPLLERLHRETGTRTRAIGAGTAAEADRFEGLDLVGWSEDSEIAAVRSMSIGIMPLLDRPFERGISGFKLIQYMPCGMPVVASPVGVISSIVEDGRNGILALSDHKWETYLRRLIAEAALRRQFGEEGRKRAVTDYSLALRRRGWSASSVRCENAELVVKGVVAPDAFAKIEPARTALAPAVHVRLQRRQSVQRSFVDEPFEGIDRQPGTSFLKNAIDVLDAGIGTPPTARASRRSPD